MEAFESQTQGKSSGNSSSAEQHPNSELSLHQVMNLSNPETAENKSGIENLQKTQNAQSLNALDLLSEERAQPSFAIRNIKDSLPQLTIEEKTDTVKRTLS